jgi:hypothetical protein|tara:strand:- start:668 stop:811 length:144 start_codon:yes stop_codon:yes gene_type:complete
MIGRWDIKLSAILALMFMCFVYYILLTDGWEKRIQFIRDISNVEGGP